MYAVSNSGSTSQNGVSSPSKQFSTLSEYDLFCRSISKMMNERRQQRIGLIEDIPSKIDDFQVKLDGTDVVLVRSVHDATVKVSLNVNRTVVREGSADLLGDYRYRKGYPSESKPDFEVDVRRGNTTIKFTCSFIKKNPNDCAIEEAEKVAKLKNSNLDEKSQSSSDDIGQKDAFVIREFAIYKGISNNSVYQCQVTPKDSRFYRSLMDFLDEKGVHNGFVDRLSRLSTAHEHKCFMESLENLKDFAYEGKRG